MRKFMLIIALMFTYVISNAQMLTTNLGDDQTYVKVTTDYVLSNNVAKYWQINTNPKYYNAQTFVVNLDSTSGNHTNIAVVFAGRVSDIDPTWTTISTTNWRCTTADTTFVVTTATETLYRQFKLTFTGTGTGTSTIDAMVFKQYYGTP